MSDLLNQIFECLDGLYYARYRRLAPGKDDPLQESSSVENREQFSFWLKNKAIFDACRKIIELEQHILEMQEVDE